MEEKVLTIVQTNESTRKYNTLIEQPTLTYDISDDKSLTKYIKKVERIVRGSIEYRRYIRYLRNEVDLNRCAFFSNIDMAIAKRVQLEFHHHPFTLYDVVDIMIRREVLKNKADVLRFCNPLKIADSVMKLHFMNMVGLVPLTTTAHQLTHSGSIFIPISMAYGNVKKFIKKYEKYMSEEIKHKIEVFSDISKKHNNLDILSTNIQYIDIEDRNKLNFLLQPQSEESMVA